MCICTHALGAVHARISEVMVVLGLFFLFFCFVTVAAEHFSDHPLLMLLSLCHYGDTGCYTSANQRGGKGALKAYASIKI